MRKAGTSLNIKRRLLISNILMIGIPAIIAMVAIFFGLLIFFSTVIQGGNIRYTDDRELKNSREFLESLIVTWIEEYENDNLEHSKLDLQKYIEKNEMFLTIKIDDKEIYRIGKLRLEQANEFHVALKSIGGKGIVSDFQYELFGDTLTVSGRDYHIRVFYQKKEVSDQKIKRDLIIFGVVIMFLVVGVIFFTNRFLTRFVYQRIQQPLDVLAKGVHHIRDGNLDYQITYSNEDEFKEICEDFNDMGARLRAYVEQAQKDEKNRKVLLASISHDLRSPLTSIRAYVEGLLDDIAKTPDAQENYLKMIKTKTEEIDQFVKRLFLFSKMEMGDFPYYPEIIDIKEEIEDYLRASAPTYKKKGLDIEINELPSEINIFVDPIYFSSVLTNIFDNSAKYKNMPKGKVSITCYVVEGESICLLFDDNGPGVSNDGLEKLFDVFYRNDPSRNNPQKGSGLGLAIVKKSIAYMGGCIEASNLPYGGLRMKILLPIWKGEQYAEDINY